MQGPVESPPHLDRRMPRRRCWWMRLRTTTPASPTSRGGRGDVSSGATGAAAGADARAAHRSVRHLHPRNAGTAGSTAGRPRALASAVGAMRHEYEKQIAALADREFYKTWFSSLSRRQFHTPRRGAGYRVRGAGSRALHRRQRCGAASALRTNGNLSEVCGQLLADTGFAYANALTAQRDWLRHYKRGDWPKQVCHDRSRSIC
jgi:hypothetical protein